MESNINIVAYCEIRVNISFYLENNYDGFSFIHFIFKNCISIKKI